MHLHRRIAATAGAALVAGLLALSCYPGDPLNVSETDAVITVYDQDADFSTKLTYAMPDTVLHLVGEGGDDDVSRKYDTQLLNTIADNLEALGYARVDDPQTADVLVVSAAAVIDYTGYSYGWYWDYWYGYPPGWGWYPYYPSYGYSYSYSVGTIFVLMIDPAMADDGAERVPTIWMAALNGLVDTGTNAQRITTGINQAFAQSKYLGAGK